MKTKKWFFWVSIGIVLIIIYKFLDNFTGIGNWFAKLFSILAPFVIAIIIFYVLLVPCRQVERIIDRKKKHRFSRVGSIFIVYVIFGLLLFLLFKFLIPILADSVVDLVTNLQGYYNSITTNEFEGNWAPFIQNNILKPAVDFISKINLQDFISADKIFSYLISAFGVVKIVINIFISFICSVYILSEREQIVSAIQNFSKAVLSERKYNKFWNYFKKGNEIFLKFISSQFIDSCLVAVLMIIIMSIMKIKYAVLLGFIIGMFNLIPFFGAILGVIIAGLVTVLTGGWKTALIMIVVVTIVQQLDANIINPKITSSRLNISPLLVVFSVTVGGAYFGIAGMFLAVPVVTIIKLLLHDFIVEKNKQRKIASEIETTEIKK